MNACRAQEALAAHVEAQAVPALLKLVDSSTTRVLACSTLLVVMEEMDQGGELAESGLGETMRRACAQSENERVKDLAWNVLVCARVYLGDVENNENVVFERLRYVFEQDETRTVEYEKHACEFAVELMKRNEAHGKAFAVRLLKFLVLPETSFSVYIANPRKETVPLLAGEVCALTTTAPCPDSVFETIFDLNLDKIWIRACETASSLIIPTNDVEARERIMPHANVRLFLLASICNSAGNEARARRFVQNQTHVLCETIAKQMWNFDLEATRGAMNALRNFVLASVYHVVADCDVLGLAALVVKSRDHNSSAIAGAVFRIAASRQCKVELKSFLKMTNSPDHLISLLSLDLTKTHPHVRVELARAFAVLMECLKLHGVSVPALETAQSVRFVAFLLISLDHSLQLEALNGILGLPDRLFGALAELEIVPGTGLSARVNEIYKECNEDLQSLSLAEVASACRMLIEKMK